MNMDEPTHLQELINKNKQRLRILELQEAEYGTASPPHIRTEIDAIREMIKLLKQKQKEMLAEPELRQRTGYLPSPPTPLINRDHEIDVACKLLKREDVRLLTVIGPPGIGKTRLSLRVAADIREAFEGGVWFIALTSISDPALVANSIAQTLGLQETAERQLIERIKDYLRDKQTLLLLDNFEQVVNAAPLIGELLTAVPHLNVLVTSREILRVYGEHQFAVPPLDSPNLKRLSPIEPDLISTLLQYPAVKLFIERAQAINSAFVVTNENALAVAKICTRLDGLPLAIELAAAHSNIFSPQKLLARLSKRLGLPDRGPRDVPKHHKTLRSMINWSYDLLKVAEQRLFAQLAIFVGGCTLETAEAVCGTTSDLGIEVLEGLGSLVDKSLIRAEPQAAGELRFTMLETLREYGLERLTEQGELEMLRRRHAAYYLAFAEQAESELWGPALEGWLERLEAEHDNLRAALAWMQESGDVDAGMRLVGALGRFWFVHGHWSEGRNWLDKILAHAGNTTPSTRTAVLGWSGYLAWRQGNHKQATMLYNERLKLCRELGDKPGMADTYRHMGMMAREQSDYEQATMLYNERLKLCRELGDKPGMADTYRHMGIMARMRGNLKQARRLSQKSQALCRSLGDQWGNAWSLRILGEVVRDQDDYKVAAALFEESLMLFQKLGDKWQIAWSYHDLGELAQLQGQVDQALKPYQESETLFRELGAKLGIAWSLHNQGHLMQRYGNQERTIEYFTESLKLFQELGIKDGMGDCLIGLGSVAGSEGQPERSVRLLGVAEALHVSTHTRMSPVAQIKYEDSLAIARAVLDSAAFEAAWVQGQAMPLKEAITDALSCKARQAAG